VVALSVQRGRRKVPAELADRRIVVGLEADRTAEADHIAEADRIAEVGHIGVDHIAGAGRTVAAAFAAVVVDLSRGGRDPLLLSLWRKVRCSSDRADWFGVGCEYSLEEGRGVYSGVLWSKRQKGKLR